MHYRKKMYTMSRALVARSLPRQSNAVQRTINQRAWFAWQCLPRDEKGFPPKFRELERSVDLHNAQLRNLVMGVSKRPAPESLGKLARALAVSLEWLVAEIGPGPVATWPVPAGPPMRRSKVHLSAGDRSGFESKTKKLPQSVRPKRPERAGE